MIEATNHVLFLATSLDDVEATRIAAVNRAEQMRRDGWAEGAPLMMMASAHAEALVAMEKSLTKQLEKAMAAHPLGAWVASMKGVGNKQAARLLAATGDPYWNPLHERPRTVSELWSYCGYHVLPVGQSLRDTHHDGADGDPSSAGVAPRRQRGVQINWNPAARKRAYVIAESCMKNLQSPYRKVYDDAKVKYAESVHVVQCQNRVRPPGKSNGCGTQANPELGAPGSPLRPGHIHARAMRATAKAILKDLWLASKAWHEQNAAPTTDPARPKTAASGLPTSDTDQQLSDTQRTPVGVHPLATDHPLNDTQSGRVGGEHSHPHKAA